MNTCFIYIYLSVILPGKLTENMFSLAAMTWGIVTEERRGMNEKIVNWGDRWFEGQIGNLARRPGLTPLLL
jgi:hypothetical protein